MTKQWFSAPPPRALAGTDQFKGSNATVGDFWSYAMSDLRVNNVRGYLAEFLVARAVGATGSRVEWDAYDVLAPGGIKIEVKSSAYLQVWDQWRPSRIVFTGLTGRTWTPQTGESPEASYNADVYVFCVHTAQDHADYDPLDVDQWEFYVSSRAAVEGLGQKAVSLAALRTIASGPVGYSTLADTVAMATKGSDDALCTLRSSDQPMPARTPRGSTDARKPRGLDTRLPERIRPLCRLPTQGR